MGNVIFSSDGEWIKKILQFFKKRESFTFINDRELNFNEKDFSNALNFLKKVKETTGFNWKEIFQILASLGLGGAGVWLIRIAIADPEPTSKLWILLAGGTVFILTSGLSLLRIFGMTWSVSATKNGFSVQPA